MHVAFKFFLVIWKKERGTQKRKRKKEGISKTKNKNETQKGTKLKNSH